MKITDVQTYAVRIPRGGPGRGEPSAYEEVKRYGIASAHIQAYMVKVSTDEGLVGWGEGQAPIVPQVPAAITDGLLKALLLGKDPLDREVLWETMYHSNRGRGHYTGFMLDAMAGVDIALWDIAGKALGQPIHKLLGGAFRDRVLLYGGIGAGATPEAAAEEAKRAVEEGYSVLKLNIRLDTEEVVERVRAIREAVGDKVGIMVDIKFRYEVAEAIKLGRALERYEAFWLESPTWPEDVAGHAEIARALDLPLAVGEERRTAYQFRELLEARAADIIMPDIARTGLTEGKRISALAQAFNVPISPHIGGGAIISIAATVQYSAGIPNFLIQEHFAGPKLRIVNELLREPLAYRDGYLEMPKGPGLGVEVDEEALARYTI